MSEKYMSLFSKDEKNLKAEIVQQKKRVYTPSPSLNWALPFYQGYSTLLYGPEGSGKSLISMLAVGSLMQADPTAYAVLISTEMRSPSPDRLRTLGIDPSRLLIRQANTLHDVFDWIASRDDRFVNSDGSRGGPGLSFAIEDGFNCRAIVIDSIKAIQGPKEQALETVEKEFMGDLSKFLNPALKSLLPVIRKHDIMTILVQQVNMNMNPDEVKYQNRKWVIPSGQSLKHFVETSALVERVESKDSKLFDESMTNMRESPIQVGHTIRTKTDKSNLDPCLNREAQFQLHYNDGVVNVGLEVATLAANIGAVYHPQNEGGKEILNQWQFGERKWIGFNNLVADAEKDPQLRTELMKAVEALSNKKTAAESEA